MLRICPQCGSVNHDGAQLCSFCDTAIETTGNPAEPVTVPSSEPEWRLEIARRLEAYRARRRRLHTDDSQSALPFSLEEGVAPEPPSSRAIPRAQVSPRQAERVEICVSQPVLEFVAPDHRFHPESALVPVASIAERLRAGLIDAAFLLAASVGFLVLFRSLGGRLAFSKVDALVYAAAFFLFYAAYFAMFTVFGGLTLGMQLRGLSVVRLDGSLPDTRPLLWRSFGYLISGATLLLGFLWSLWDEDRLTWQDRISQTYLTSAAPPAEVESFDPPSGQHTLAR